MAEVVQQYTIRVRGLLDETWNERFNPMQIYHHGSDTLLHGSLPDHSALYGIIAKIQSLGLELLHLEQHVANHSSEILTSPSIQERTTSQ
jgi:hypothetical protein